jgi:ABC-type amino acid transport substrate-binding protein
MKELSLHILDIIQNSISAGADTVIVKISEDTKKDTLDIEITDNGKAMTSEQLAQVSDPFYTTRTTRKVGIGIPLFKAAAERCNGKLEVFSELNRGTKVVASFVHSHIDRAPIGNMPETMLTLILSNPQIDFIYKHYLDGRQFELDTRKIKEVIAGMSINDPEIYSWIKGYLDEGLKELWRC